MSSLYDDASMGQLTAEDMLIVGAFAPTFRSSLWLTLELAANELNAERLAGTSVVPPILVTLCDDERQSAEAGMSHVTRELGARAVVASLEDSVLRSVVASASAEALLVSPEGPVSAIEGMGDDGARLWYLGARYQDAATAYERLLPSVFERALERVDDPDRFKLVTIIGAATEDRALASAVRRFIRVNGESADSLLFQGRYRTFELAEGSEVDRAAQLVQIANYAPDVVLVFAGGSFDDVERAARASVVHTLESLVRPDWQPSYVFGPRNVHEATLRRLAAASQSFRGRAVGVGWAAPLDPVTASEVALRFRTAFPAAVDPSVNFEAFVDAYDALYLIAHAQIASMSDATPSRASGLVSGLERITRSGGDVVPVGSGGLARAASLLRDVGGFDLRGVRGRFEFQSETHGRAGVAWLYCWGDSGDPREAATFQDASLAIAGGGCADVVLPLRESGIGK